MRATPAPQSALRRRNDEELRAVLAHGPSQENEHAAKMENLYPEFGRLSCVSRERSLAGRWHQSCSIVGDGWESADTTETQMFYYALIFLIVAVIAGALGLSGVAGLSANIAWILFIVGLIFAVIFFLRGRRPPPI